MFENQFIFVKFLIMKSFQIEKHSYVLKKSKICIFSTFETIGGGAEQGWQRALAGSWSRAGPSLSCSSVKVVQGGPRQNSEFWAFRRARAGPRILGPDLENLGPLPPLERRQRRRRVTLEKMKKILWFKAGGENSAQNYHNKNLRFGTARSEQKIWSAKPGGLALRLWAMPILL